MIFEFAELWPERVRARHDASQLGTVAGTSTSEIDGAILVSWTWLVPGNPEMHLCDALSLAPQMQN